MTRFVTVNRSTDYLLPPSVDDWLPKDHLARFVVEIVDQLDLSEITRQYRGGGSAAVLRHVSDVLIRVIHQERAQACRPIDLCSIDELARDIDWRALLAKLRRSSGPSPIQLAMGDKLT